jgi:hypothetical protein
LYTTNPFSYYGQFDFQAEEFGGVNFFGIRSISKARVPHPCDFQGCGFSHPPENLDHVESKPAPLKGTRVRHPIQSQCKARPRSGILKTPEFIPLQGLLIFV